MRIVRITSGAGLGKSTTLKNMRDSIHPEHETLSERELPKTSSSRKARSTLLMK